ESFKAIDKNTFWIGAGQIFLIYGLVISSLTGAMQGQILWVMLRDIIPFLYLFLPLFFYPVIKQNVQFIYILTAGIIVIGLVFSLRSIFFHEDLLYLENMPTVLLSCLLLLGGGMTFYSQGQNKLYMLAGITLFGLSSLPIIAMIETVQRASIGSVCFYLIAISAYFLWLKPRKSFVPFLLVVMASYVVFMTYNPQVSQFFEKNDKVGLNMRPEEFKAVWQILSADPVHFLFGTGWGGTFHSPAVANLRVNFTHNFFSSVLLKMGVCGLIFASAYIAGILERLIRVILINPVLGLAILAPVLIDLLLYASFKSLDFGLVLLMIPVSLIYLRNSESS
ncbi:MAG: O-antigen ligase family protein, partial [Alphaproteobacteria bacterium]|nr:O-antigen ligase family protein [Alphaproteobacteria bacterium]